MYSLPEQRSRTAVKRSVGNLENPRLHCSLNSCKQQKVYNPPTSPSKQPFGSPIAVALQPAVESPAEPNVEPIVPARQEPCTQPDIDAACGHAPRILPRALQLSAAMHAVATGKSICSVYQNFRNPVNAAGFPRWACNCSGGGSS